MSRHLFTEVVFKAVGLLTLTWGLAWSLVVIGFLFESLQSDMGGPGGLVGTILGQGVASLSTLLIGVLMVTRSRAFADRLSSDRSRERLKSSEYALALAMFVIGTWTVMLHMVDLIVSLSMFELEEVEPLGTADLLDRIRFTNVRLTIT